MATAPFSPHRVDEQAAIGVHLDVGVWAPPPICGSSPPALRGEAGVLEGLITTRTITWSNRVAARRIMSRCPKVMGSKLPGQTENSRFPIMLPLSIHGNFFFLP